MNMKKSRKKRLGQIDYGIFYTVIVLLCIGIVMVYSASSYYAMFKNQASMYYLKRQIMIAPIGIIAMYFMMCFDYHKIKRYTIALMIGSIPLLLAVFLFEGTNGAQRWIRLGPLSFQPSDLAKYVVVLFFYTFCSMILENSCSSIIFIPSAFAFSSLLPADSPAITNVVLEVTAL